MLKKLLTTSFVAATFLLSGCGSDSEGESRLETQNMIDKGNYQGVIDKLDTKTPKTPEENLALAAAYMGRAGLSLSDLITVVGDSADTNGDAFGAFISSIDHATKDSKAPLADLNKATAYYKNVVGDKCSDKNVVLTDTQKDICTYKGLSETMSAATAMNYIADDISSVFDDTNNTQDDKLTASTCAMQYAVDNGVGGVDPKIDATVCKIEDKGNKLKFANEHSYLQIYVTVLGSEEKSYEYLLTNNGAVRSTAVTKGYCSTQSFDPRVEDKKDPKYTANMHVCPVNEDKDAKELTTGAVIADALNNGTDSVAAGADEETQKDINEFKQNVLASSHKQAGDEITEEDIVNYLNENNEE